VLPGDDIHAMGDAMKRRPASERAAVDEELARLGAAPEPIRLTEEDVRELARDQEIGFHTLGHDLLPALSDEDLQAAVTAGRERLEGVCGRAIDLIAYPHGAAGPREARAARRAGFRMGFTSVAAACGPATDPLLIGRVEPGHAPLGLFALKLERTLGRRG
jgi:peptidoglycan/xylan/chitin deacetylase (PgdA/CDA1 family)